MVFYLHLFTFVPMKKRKPILSLFFGLLVLFALLLQSVHSFHHLEKVFSEKQCHHKYAKNITEITHSHNKLEHCFVCEFTFCNAINTTFFSFEYKKPVISTAYSFFHSKEITQYFKGSLFALRAPPTFIV